MKYLFFDTETTGLIRHPLAPLSLQPYVIEFCGIIHDESGKKAKTRELNYRIKPPIKISQEITDITGITNADLEGVAPFAERAQELRDFIRSADMMIAHNLRYDMQMLSFEFRRASLPVDWPAKKLCTVEATEHIKGRRLRLVQLHEYLFKEGFDKAHSAHGDVTAMMRCFFECKKRGIIA